MKEYTICILLFCLIACDSPSDSSNGQALISAEEQAQDSLFDEVMAIHDEVMPEMDHIFQLQKKLNAHIDSLQTENTITPISVDSLKQLSDDLKEADEAMMQWMRSNDFEFDSIAHDEIMRTLASEKEKIIVVKEKMLNSIHKAEDLLHQFETP